MWNCHCKPAPAAPSVPRRPRRQGGYTYLLVLFLVAGLGLLAAQVGVVWRQEAQREREAQLLAVGQEFARALASYRKAGPDQAYPQSLEQLVEDKRFPNPRRHLRRLYRDPMTDQPRWGLVREAGRIVGVHSLSEAAPIRVHDLPAALGQGAAGARSYGEWVFRAGEEGAAPAGQGNAPGT